MFLINRPLYNLCQMFPESASDAVKFVLRDAMHEMEGTVETTGRAAFPGLDVVSRGLRTSAIPRGIPAWKGGGFEVVSAQGLHGLEITRGQAQEC